MNEKNKFALVPRLPGELDKAEPGAKRILSDMVADTLGLATREPPHINRTLRIVMVNDESSVLQSFELIIRHSFRDVAMLTFADGAAALEELSRTDPDLLITDDSMPDMSGAELCSRLLARKVTYPIIVDSAYEPTEQWVREFAERGLNVSFLPLPCDVTSLRNLMEACLKNPRYSASPDETKPTKNQTKTPKPRGKLLIVDDEDGVRQCMRLIFKDDYDVFLAGDGPTAIELAKQNDIDVAVTNINMPGMSGIELLERLKSLKPDIEVIIATAFETPDTFRQALRMGACDYIIKPFDCSTMRAAVSKAMQHRALESERTAARKQSSSNMEEVADLTLQTRPPRIVVVDNEDLCLEVFKPLIREWFKDVTLLLFSNSDEAWQDLEREDPDLLILDMVLSGPEMLPLLAEHKVKYPILLTSGSYTEERMRQHADPNLSISVLSKPFSAEQVWRELLIHVGPSDNPERQIWKDAP